MRSTDILIVDDEMGIRELLSEILQDEGYSVALAENAEKARQLRNQTRPALVLLDIWMPDCDGITLLKEWAKAGQLNMPVIMMSGHASIDTAVEATKIGALDFLEKPIALQKLLGAVQKGLKYGEIQTSAHLTLDRLGKSDAIKEMQRQLERATKIRHAPVLLLGEPGSPFELVARYFHESNTPWVGLTKMEQITEAPVELLKAAQDGVLYLGDISRYPKAIQTGIAQLLDRKERSEVRVVCCCSQPVESLLAHPEHDSALIMRLCELSVVVPPLRQQADDIITLSNQLLSQMVESKQVPAVRLTTPALNALRQYAWPGNLEQLRSVIKSLAQTASGMVVDAPQVVQMLSQFQSGSAVEGIGLDFNLPLRELREELERRYFEYHIQQEGGNMSKVAQRVGLERTHLYRKLKQLGITFSRRQDDK